MAFTVRQIYREGGFALENKTIKECYETDYWLEILFKTNTIDEGTYKKLINKCGTIRRKLIASITTTKSK